MTSGFCWIKSWLEDAGLASLIKFLRRLGGENGEDLILHYADCIEAVFKNQPCPDEGKP